MVYFYYYDLIGFMSPVLFLKVWSVCFGITERLIKRQISLAPSLTQGIRISGNGPEMGIQVILMHTKKLITINENLPSFSSQTCIQPVLCGMLDSRLWEYSSK